MADDKQDDPFITRSHVLGLLEAEKTAALRNSRHATDDQWHTDPASFASYAIHLQRLIDLINGRVDA
jgi:hypothetical protein